MVKLILALLLISSVTQAKKPKYSRRPQNKVIKVMIIDTGIGFNNKLTNIVQYSQGLDYQDRVGHGTHIAGIVSYGNFMDDKVCSNVQIYSCRGLFKDDSTNDGMKYSNECVQRAINMDVDIINYSGGGPDFSVEEYTLFFRFTNQGGILVAAAGNEGVDLNHKHFYPASYAYKTKDKSKTLLGLKNIFVVENECRNGRLCASSNYHPLAVRALGDNIVSTGPNNTSYSLSGTSQATAQITHILVQQKCNDL